MYFKLRAEDCFIRFVFEIKNSSFETQSKLIKEAIVTCLLQKTLRYFITIKEKHNLKTMLCLWMYFIRDVLKLINIGYAYVIDTLHDTF